MVKCLSVAALCAVCALGAAPAGAQGFNFGLHFGDEADDLVPQLPMCLTDRQIRDAIARRGYTDISLNVPDDKRVRVRATQGGVVYLIDYNYCADYIRGRQALRPAG